METYTESFTRKVWQFEVDKKEAHNKCVEWIEALQRSGMSFAHIARLCGVTRQQIQAVHAGHVMIPSYECMQIIETHASGLLHD